MARRLSALTNLRKYVMEDVPRWRTHGGDFFYAQPYNDALIFGDSASKASSCGHWIWPNRADRGAIAPRQ